MRQVRFRSDKPRDRWIELMSAALAEAALPPEIDSKLRAFFDSTATFLMNRPA